MSEWLVGPQVVDNASDWGRVSGMMYCCGMLEGMFWFEITMVAESEVRA